jgi:hypothetical protein
VGGSSRARAATEKALEGRIPREQSAGSLQALAALRVGERGPEAGVRSAFGASIDPNRTRAGTGEPEPIRPGQSSVGKARAAAGPPPACAPEETLRTRCRDGRRPATHAAEGPEPFARRGPGTSGEPSREVRTPRGPRFEAQTRKTGQETRSTSRKSASGRGRNVNDLVCPRALALQKARARQLRFRREPSRRDVLTVHRVDPANVRRGVLRGPGPAEASVGLNALER